MYKVVIVDDDRIIRKGLATVVPWEKHGFQLVGEAADGEQGLELIERENPHIVVSDIKMPFLDGLEMAKEIRKKNNRTKIILLTGYEDFKYAHEAIKVRAFDYLLKPVETESLLEKVKQASREWEDEYLREKQISEGSQAIEKEFLKKLSNPLSGAIEVPRFEEECIPLIKLGLSEKVSGYLENTQNNLMSKDISLEDVKLMAIGLMSLIIHESSKWAKTWDHSRFIDVQNEIMSMETITEIFETLEKMAVDLAAFVNGLNKNQKHSLVDKAIDYIKQNYHNEDLSLQTVAEKVHVSPAYLSNLFKVEKGFNFGEFLLETRMKAAMEIFRQRDFKTYEVAEQVGYANPQYFSSSFKKYTGYSPAEFKKLK
ncbi:response regulator transcription factor [Mesobacillus foraminis]|uniref:response regulator transcription factor n=1 Tax=Mesobacillus foraminis TaxID=279826 RepID=UPI000EF45621|nr:response regulator [Mesobacillus foraminis]